MDDGLDTSFAVNLATAKDIPPLHDHEAAIVIRRAFMPRWTRSPSPMVEDSEHASAPHSDSDLPIGCESASRQRPSTSRRKRTSSSTPGRPEQPIDQPSLQDVKVEDCTHQDHRTSRTRSPLLSLLTSCAWKSQLSHARPPVSPRQPCAKLTSPLWATSCVSASSTAVEASSDKHTCLGWLSTPRRHEARVRLGLDLFFFFSTQESPKRF